jgi:hypothetical protein
LVLPAIKNYHFNNFLLKLSKGIIISRGILRI